ncbi:MAG: 3D domain-containing protein [Candidatus Krumholzibacteriota bacterium]|nr:3D domain-containing protein [Candidatus Krumholzibacteriota bacterium]
MRLLLTPVLALVFALGLQPAGSWRGAGGGVARPVALSERGTPAWDRVDEWLGLEGRNVYPVTVTGYSSTRDQCDADPLITASNKRVRPGIIALSRDMLRRYNPEAPFHWGDRVYIPGVGEFVVEDSMNARYTRRADIWFPSRTRAAQWGVRELKLVPMPPDSLLL